MKKVILFDLYDTILKDVFFSFNEGIQYLHDRFFTEVCSWEEMIGYSNTFLPLYEKRKTDHSEICLIKDEIPLYFEKFGVLMPEDHAELEYAIMNKMQQETILEEVRFVLEELKKQEIPMYILSNSIFTGRSAECLLNEFGILHYFKEVFSSADYGVRKPSPRFFQMAIDRILSENSGIRETDILYVGNDYITDVMGAVSAGLETVWYNVKHLQNEQNIPVSEIDDFKKLLEIVQQK